MHFISLLHQKTQMLSKLLKPNSLILIILLIIAAILRLWNFDQLALMDDELSALSRLEYDTFDDFLYYGIQVDGHPAGIQLFIYYFTSLFGFNTVLIKLPFISTGIASIYLSYRIGKKWFSESTGLFTAALLVGIQYTIIYSDIIRPYAPGLFFCLLLVNLWTDIFILKKTSWIKFIAFAFTITATAYTHYFALLFALIVSLTGLCLITKKIALKYISSGIFAFVLFIPHLNIFLYQLQVGGVGIGQGGWLKAPDLQFIINYLFYLFNYSYLYLSLALIIFTATVLRFKNNKEGVPKRFILLIWFCTPFAIGYWYSILINPVLQFSVLLFSAPFLFIFLTAFEQESKTWLNATISFSLVIIAIVSLQGERHHYDTFYKQPVGSFYDYTKQFTNDSTLLVGSHESVFIDHYNKLNDNHFTYFSTDEDCTSVAQFQELLKNPKFNQVILGSVSPSNLGMANLYFPKVAKFEQGINLENIVLQKGKSDTSLYYKDYELGSEFWENDNKQLKQNNNGFHLNQTWGIGKTFELDSLLDSKYDIIEFYAEIESLSNDPQRCLILVLDFRKDGKKVKWTGYSSKNATSINSLKFKIVNAQHIFGNEGTIPNTVKAYIWNKNKSDLMIKKTGLRVRKGNPNKYALFNKLK